MAPHILAKEILQKIILEKIPFSLALKQAFKHHNVDKNERGMISAIVGCALRHYLVMERLIKDASSVPQQTPLAVTTAPPSEVILPPPVAVMAEMLVTADVVITGRL